MMVVTLMVWSFIVLALAGIAAIVGAFFPVVAEIVWCVLLPAMIIMIVAVVLRRLK